MGAPEPALALSACPRCGTASLRLRCLNLAEALLLCDKCTFPLEEPDLARYISPTGVGAGAADRPTSSPAGREPAAVPRAVDAFLAALCTGRPGLVHMPHGWLGGAALAGVAEGALWLGAVHERAWCVLCALQAGGRWALLDPRGPGAPEAEALAQQVQAALERAAPGADWFRARPLRAPHCHCSAAAAALSPLYACHYAQRLAAAPRGTSLAAAVGETPSEGELLRLPLALALGLFPGPHAPAPGPGHPPHGLVAPASGSASTPRAGPGDAQELGELLHSFAGLTGAPAPPNASPAPPSPPSPPRPPS